MPGAGGGGRTSRGRCTRRIPGALVSHSGSATVPLLAGRPEAATSSSTSRTYHRRRRSQLLFLVRLLRRLVGHGKIDIIGVTPALVGALTAFELPDHVTVVDVRGRRWPG